jgi:hypothetical protein
MRRHLRLRDAYEFQPIGNPRITICVQAESLEDARAHFLRYLEEQRIEDPQRWASDYQKGNIDAFECKVLPDGSASLEGGCQPE